MLRLALVTFLWPAGVLGSEGVSLAELIPGAAKRGEATYRWLGLPLYHARLFTNGGKAFTWSDEFAIELTYARSLSGSALVDSTLSELERMGTKVDPMLRDQLAGCFDGVDRGDRYLAVTTGENAIRFWRNGHRACTLERANIKRNFMAIFLGGTTRSSAFTARLKGG